MLSPESWARALEQAKHTSAKRIRTDHDCGTGRTLTVSIDDRGAHAWCFRCNDKGWLPPEPVPLAVRLARLADQNKADLKVQQAVCLPSDGVRAWADWPEPARLWLLKAGLCAADLPRLGAYYHPPTLRVVVPVFRGSEPVFWQARALDGRVPKYLAPGISKASVLAQYGSGHSITLTEDLLSAYKVGKVSEAWCMLGTSLNDNMLANLIEDGRRVNVWLDPDPPGIRAAAKVLAKLRAAGVQCSNIVSNADPKLVHLSTIKELV